MSTFLFPTQHFQIITFQVNRYFEVHNYPSPRHSNLIVMLQQQIYSPFHVWNPPTVNFHAPFRAQSPHYLYMRIQTGYTYTYFFSIPIKIQWIERKSTEFVFDLVGSHLHMFGMLNSHYDQIHNIAHMIHWLGRIFSKLSFTNSRSKIPSRWWTPRKDAALNPPKASFHHVVDMENGSR